MAGFRPSRDLSSLRFRLPLLLMLYCSAVAFVLYIVADRVQESRFEQAFQSEQLLRATEIQSRTRYAYCLEVLMNSLNRARKLRGGVDASVNAGLSGWPNN